MTHMTHIAHKPRAENRLAGCVGMTHMTHNRLAACVGMTHMTHAWPLAVGMPT